MKLIPNAVSAKLGRQILKTQKHSPTILFVGGVTGVVATTVLACRATLKLDEVLDETQQKMKDAKSLKHENYSEKDRKQDITYLYIRSAVQVTKLYAPAFIVGGLSIAALTGSHNILTKRNAGLTAAYAALDKGFSDYRKRVVDDLGEEKDLEYRYAAEDHTIVEDTDKGPKKVNVKRPGEGANNMYARFFDELNRNWNPSVEANRAFLLAQQQYANDMLIARGHVFLNDVYDSLGIDRSSAGAVVGWVVSKEGDNFVDFGLYNGGREGARAFVNGRESAILLDFNVDGVIYDKI